LSRVFRDLQEKFGLAPSQMPFYRSLQLTRMTVDLTVSA